MVKKVIMERINIAFGITKDWLKYTYVTVCSILSNANRHDRYKFYFLCEESDDDFDRIYEKLNEIHEFEYEFIKMNNTDFDGLVHDVRVGISALYRLKLPSLVNDDKIIYLDSDLVVLKDIKELWEYDINDYLVAAVEDKYAEVMACHANLEPDEVYFNSGVMIMNLKKFREHGLEKKIFDKLKTNDTYSDQDVLNDLCRKQVLYLPLKYNLMVLYGDTNSFPTRRKEFEESILSPFILHYTVKPWVLPVQYSEYWTDYSKKLG